MVRTPILLGLLILLPMLLPAVAADEPVSFARPGGGIVFTFNGGYASGTVAADILDAHGMRGTFYVASSLLRQGAYYTAYLSAADVANLSMRGHEIGSMGATQVDLTSLSRAQRDVELAGSRTALETITGAPVRALAYPYGAVNDAVAGSTAAVYSSGRVLSWNVADFLAPADPYRVPGFAVRQSTSLAEAKWIVDHAVANDVTIVLSFDRIVTSPGTYDWTPADLDALAAYAAAKGVRVATLDQVLRGIAPPPLSVPSAPTLRASAANARVDLAWNVPANGGSPITGYALHRAAAGGGEVLYRNLPAVTGFRDLNVTNGVSYAYRVSALNALGASARSNAVAATPTEFSVPSGAAVVFTFDDGSKTHVGAAQTLAQSGFRGTFYIISECTRSEADREMCMSNDDVRSLAAGGHEIASHTVKHVDLAAASSKRLKSELVNSRSALKTLTGQPVEHIAYPYGSHNANVRAEVAKSYTTGRIFLAGPPIADLPGLLAQSGSDPYVIPGVGVMRATSLATAKAYVDHAVSHNTTIVLAFHDLVESGGDEYTWTPAQFSALVDHTRTTRVPVKTMAQAYG